MAVSYDALKTRQRKERDGHPESLALRVHRALSWLNRAEQCEDMDGQYIFLWIAFNAAYANETGEIRIRENERHRDFLNRLVELDVSNRLSAIVWSEYPGAIRVLLDNQYVYKPFWDHLNQLPSNEDWQERFTRDKKISHRALAAKDTGKVLNIVFQRLYTLRNQLIHGGATWSSTVNRSQLRDGTQLLQEIVPVVIEIMMDNAQAHWGEASYPVS